MGKEFFNKADARMRINGTICMYDGRAVYVEVDENVPDKEAVKICALADVYKHPSKRKQESVKYTDDKFVYKSPLLGYMQHGEHAYYVTRIPDRKQRQGLSYEICTYKRHDGAPSLGMDTVLYSQGMADCIEGRYLNLKEAINKLIDHGFKTVPIHRHIAVGVVGGRTIALYYRTKFIGTKNTSDTHFKLFDFVERPFLIKLLAKQGVYTC